MINYFKFAHDFTICLDELQALSDLTLSDDPGPPDEPSDPPDEPSDPSALGPANPYCLKRFTERFCKEYEDRENYGKHLLNQFLLPPIL